MKYELGTRPVAGLAVPLAALRSSASSGVGEFPDLAALGPVCEKAGIRLVQLLPVNDSGRQTSPYSALSAFALHPLHLSLQSLPEARAFRKETAAFRARFEREGRFPYDELLLAKLDLLDRIYEANMEAIAADKSLDAWIIANSWIRSYAVYMRLKRLNEWRSWKEWNEHRDPGPGEIEALWNDPSLAVEHRKQAWVQYRCEQQFSAAARSLAERGIALKGDLPILLNEDSADAWSDREAFRDDLRAGAPPDAGAPLGQNWGFPIYDWDALARRGYSFWIDRLRSADKFYAAYRIDHVLGFFRIWALPAADREGALGRFVPGGDVGADELRALGFDGDRIRWMSEPHIRTADLLRALAATPDPAGQAAGAIRLALDRIGNEELFLFKPSIRGEKDIDALDLGAMAKEFLAAAWRDRVLVGTGTGRYVKAWRWKEASAWATLSDHERGRLEDLFGALGRQDDEAWEEQGRRLLGVLKGATEMLPCAEDLGSVPPCVAPTLAELGILGLRIPRWSRYWHLDGQPFVPLAEYPRLTVTASSVHDTSTLREWYEREGEGARFLSFLEGKDAAAEPWSPEIQARLMSALAKSNSLLFVAQLQDWLGLAPGWNPADCREERVNVPGTVNDSNWTWRMPRSLEELADDELWAAAAGKVVAARPRT
ncbi:MAG: 4-alpha-glucanotransferase [Spirochaetales bacterium]|nr:4-alpha-glucanotransferase [Spirochaetales bacterium]